MTTHPLSQPGGLGSGVGSTPVWTKADIAHLTMRQQILDGTLAPGQPLDQGALAERLGLSTTPVREALRRLEAEGMVVARAHRETMVAPLSLEALEQIYTVRLSLDPLAASLAAARMNPERAAQLRKILVAAPQEEETLRVLEHTRAIHFVMYNQTDNQVLISILERLWNLSDRYRFMLLHDNNSVHAALSEHEELIDALVSGDPAKSAELMHGHVVESLRRIRPFAAANGADAA